MEGNIVRELYEEFCDSVEIFYEKIGKWRYPFIVTLPFIVGVIVCMLDFWVLAYYTGMIGTSIIHMLALLFNIVFLIMWRQWGSYMLKKGKSRILSSFLTHSVHLFVMIVLVFLSIDHQTPPSPPVEDFNFVKWTPIYELLPKFYCMGSMGILASSMLWSTWNNLAYIGISSLSFSACVFSYGYGKARRAEIKAGNLKKNSYEKFCDRIEDFYKKLGKWGYPFVWILPMLTGTAGCLLNLWAASEVGIIIGFILEIFALLIAALHLLLWVKWSEVQFKMGKSYDFKLSAYAYCLYCRCSSASDDFDR